MPASTRQPADTQTTLHAVVEEVEQVDLVRVEKSLNSLGFFASTTKSDELTRTITQVLRNEKGQKVQAKAVIEGVQSLGLPTTADRDKYMAFMKIAMDQKEFQGEIQNPIRFTGADMIKLLGLRKGGFHYDEIDEWCERMTATIIRSEWSIYLADRKNYAKDIFHVFDRRVLMGQELDDGTRSDCYQVYLSKWQLDNLNQGYLLPLDFNAYLKLRRDIAKALFGHLSVWFYASRGHTIEKKYKDFCELLNIRAYTHLSKAREILQPSLEELKNIGYLSSWDLGRTTKGADLKLTLSPGSRIMDLPNFAKIAKSDRSSNGSHLPPWVAELVQKGVVERKARQLALEIPDSQPVSDQIEYAEHLIQQDLKSRAKIANPAGFLIWAIESNLSVPIEFETSRKRRLRELEQQETRNKEAQRFQLEQEYEVFVKEQVQNRLDSQFTEEQLDEALRESMKEIKQQQPTWFNRVPDRLRREVALRHLESKVRDNMNLPSFEDWSRRVQQQQLFA